MTKEQAEQLAVKCAEAGRTQAEKHMSPMHSSIVNAWATLSLAYSAIAAKETQA